MRNKPLPGMMKHSPMKQKEHEYEREESMRTVSGVDKFIYRKLSSISSSFFMLKIAH